MKQGLIASFVVSLALVATLSWVSPAAAAPADLDTGFGGDGIVDLEGPAGPSFPREAGARMAIGP